ncbi:MAG: hypothetical protein EOM34_04595 [Clostridia bacterium]|nr:hypothetical protein [Clostridia bacterium]
MKKLISVLILGMMCLCLVGCSSGAKKETEPVTTVAEIETETETETESETDEGIKEIGVGEPVTVETEWGSYILAITGVSETDWWERANKNTDKTVILVEYSVENIDFSNEYTSGVVISTEAFKISDDENYLLKDFSSGYDDRVNFFETVDPGYKSESALPYILDRDTEYIDVVITRSSGDIAKVRVNIE